MKKRTKILGLILLCLALIGIGVMVVPEPKEAGARWPTHATVSLQDDEFGVGGAEVTIHFWNQNEQAYEPGVWELSYASNGMYVTDSFEDEPPEGTTHLEAVVVPPDHYEFEDPEDPNQRIEMTEGEDHFFEWELEAVPR